MTIFSSKNCCEECLEASKGCLVFYNKRRCPRIMPSSYMMPSNLFSEGINESIN